ncbi:WD40-repeat-containing domain protein [Triangularia verruculosa]|uniref:WD40-repeat-containing domain protein n=1 Tax=Triangularia verruculosa TaxID=2587418 RepID=A0AAN6XV30_9PEZI|nr:WD40-repeat-containing domain protein [Triangularia verruculosa]
MRTNYIQLVDEEPHPWASNRPRHNYLAPTENGNGNSNTNNEDMYGSSSAVRLRGGAPSDYCGHNREEITRILIQALDDLGYSSAAQIVSQQSGYEVESSDVAAFRAAVLDGEWDRAEKLLWGEGTTGGLVLAPGADRNSMRFKLREQKFLEMLERREVTKALAVLRKELSVLCMDQPPSVLATLSRYMMCADADDLRSKAAWDGAEGSSRRVLLSQLSACISPSVMLPERRLAVLLDNVKQNQIDKCLYHTTINPPSLYSDHICERSQFPTEVMLELDKQQGEVWQIKFSPSGDRLATCGSAKGICLWDSRTFNLIRVLNGHDTEVSNIAWSPDDTMLISCSMDGYAKVWNTHTGELVKQLDKFGEPVSSAVWLPDGQSFITGSFDKPKSLCQWDLSGNLLYTWTRHHRTEDLALSPDGHWLVAMDDQCALHVYNVPRREHDWDVYVESRLTSVSVSQDSRYILVNTVEDEAQLYEIETREMVQKYKGHSGGQVIIRASFGGANENFVVSGSEDGSVYIWHKITGTLVHKGEAHSPRVNSVSWNPRDPGMYATCGDEGKVKIWASPERARSWAFAKAQSPHVQQAVQGGQRSATNGTSASSSRGAGAASNGWAASGSGGAAGGSGGPARSFPDGGNDEEVGEEEEEGEEGEEGGEEGADDEV